VAQLPAALFVEGIAMPISQQDLGSAIYKSSMPALSCGTLRNSCSSRVGSAASLLQ